MEIVVKSPVKIIEENKLIAFIRSSSAEDAEEMIKASMNGGFRIFLVSMQTPQACRLIEEYSKKDVLVGAGSVVDGEMAERAIRAGAHVIASSYTDRDVISVAKNYDRLVIQGAMTPTEAVNAYQFGADFVMIYPATAVGGSSYLKSLKNAAPYLKLIASGGITLETVSEYLRDGFSVCLQQSLFERPLVRTDRWADISDKARQFTQKLESLRVAK